MERDDDFVIDSILKRNYLQQSRDKIKVLPQLLGKSQMGDGNMITADNW